MAKLDKFMEMMVQRKAQRAVLTSDEPFELFVQGQKVQGSVSSSAQLNEALAEITPIHLRPQLSQDGFFTFRHELPQGDFDISIENFFGKLKITISPATAKLQSPPPSVQPVAPPFTDVKDVSRSEPNASDSSNDTPMAIAGSGLLAGAFIGWNVVAAFQGSVSTAAISASVCAAIGFGIGLAIGMAGEG